MIEKGWRGLGGEIVNLRSAIERELEACPDAQVIIASDSQQVGRDNGRPKTTEFVTVVVVHRPTKGGRVFFNRERIPRIRELRTRLWEEAWRSTELAMELSEPEDDRPGIPVAEVHIDANVDPQHRSAAYVQELVGLAVGQGFKAVVKPDAWAASHAADHAVKHKDERRKPHAQNTGRRRRSA